MIRTKLLSLLQAFVLAAGIPAVHGQQLSGTQADSKLKPGAKSESGSSGGLFTPNPYTGTCDINIPIYSYATDYGDFGISLSYNTKGIRVDQLSTEIGLGFNLNASGTITRIVRDLPDELNIEADTMVYSPDPWPNTPALDTVKLNRYWRLKGKYATYTESAASAADTLIYRDRECDEFQLSLPTGSYSFYLGKNGNNFIHPAKGLKIETVFNGTVMTNINSINPGYDENSNYLDFIITDAQGNKFYFIRSEYANRSMTDLYGYGGLIAAYYATTQWVLDKAVLANGAVIRYTYQDFNASTIFSGTSHYREERSDILGDYASTDEPGMFIRSKKLQLIQYPNNVTAELVYDATGRMDYPGGALREFKISSGANCMRYKLNQAYFYSDPGTDGDYEMGYTESNVALDRHKKSRLKLKGISILSCDGATEEPFYTFDYNTAENLPPRGSLSQDLFGYFNGVANTTTGIPSHTALNKTTVYGSNRGQAFAKMKAGILTKITNGYGGSTEFFYGPHLSLSNPLLGLPTDALYFGVTANDGFRVDSIVEQDSWHPDNKKVTVLTYTGGQRFLTGGYFHYPQVVHQPKPDSVLRQIFTSNYLTQHQFVQGANQGYSGATILVKTGAGQQLSRRVFTFTNFYDATSGGSVRYMRVGGGKHFHQFPYTNKQYLRDWEMGLPLTITGYDDNNRIVEETINKYRFTLDSTSTIGNVENTRIAYAQLNASVNYRPLLYAYTDNYRPFTGAALPEMVVTKRYVSDSRSITDTAWYQYDGRNNLKNVVTRNSEGAKVRTETVYNYNLNATSGSTVYAMNQAKLEKITGMQRWLVGASGFSSDSLLDASINTYTYSSGLVWPRSTYRLQNYWPLSYSNYTGWSGGGALPYPYDNLIPAYTGAAVANYKETSEVLATDAKGNPLETQLNSQGQYLAMVWDTLTGNKLAEAANCRYADIGYNSFEYADPGSFASTLVTGGNLTYYANQIVNATTSIKAVTGGKMYQLTNSASSKQDITGSVNLVAGKEYIISFWARNATPRLFASDSAISLTNTVVYTNSNSWKHYIVRFTPATSGKVKLSGPATPVTMYFDEIRLYPADAAMTSQTWEPLFGKSSSTDASGRVTYYEYDKMGRQAVVRDQEGFVLSKTQYTINGAE